MLPIQRFVDIAAGAVPVHAHRQELGWFDETDPHAQYKLRQLRVGLAFPANGVKYTALLTVPGGLEIGPIDIPFRFNVEGPVNIAFTADSANTVNQQIMCTWHDLPDCPNLYGATYLIRDAASNPVAIFPWVQAVTIYSGGTATFYDAGMTQICTATGPQLVARPRLAEFIQTSGELGAILYHY